MRHVTIVLSTDRELPNALEWHAITVAYSSKLSLHYREASNVTVYVYIYRKSENIRVANVLK